MYGQLPPMVRGSAGFPTPQAPTHAPLPGFWTASGAQGLGTCATGPIRVRFFCGHLRPSGHLSPRPTPHPARSLLSIPQPLQEPSLVEPKGAADVRRGDRGLSLDEAVDRLRGKLEHRGHLFGRQINRNGARNRGPITRGGQAHADGRGGCPWASRRNTARIFRSPVWWSSMPEITGNLSAPAWTRSRSDLGERPELLGGPLLSESATHVWTAVARGMPAPADPAWPIASSRGIGPGRTNGDLGGGYLVRQPRCKMQPARCELPRTTTRQPFRELSCFRPTPTALGQDRHRA